MQGSVADLATTVAVPTRGVAWLRVLRPQYQLDNLLTWFGATALAASDATFHLGWFCVGLVMLAMVVPAVMPGP